MCAFRIKPPRHRKAIASEAVTTILGRLGFEPQKMALFDIWDRETKSLIRGCEAVALQGTRLCVRVPSVVHRQELLYMKARILKRINEAMGRKAITDIRFEIGSDKDPKNTLKKEGGLRGENPARKWNGSFRKRYD